MPACPLLILLSLRQPLLPMFSPTARQALPLTGQDVPAYVTFVPAFQPRLIGTSSTSDCCTLLPAAASHTCRVTCMPQSRHPEAHQRRGGGRALPQPQPQQRHAMNRAPESSRGLRRGHKAARMPANMFLLFKIQGQTCVEQSHLCDAHTLH
jgi:hypothetical protein